MSFDNCLLQFLITTLVFTYTKCASTKIIDNNSNVVATTSEEVYSNVCDMSLSPLSIEDSTGKSQVVCLCKSRSFTVDCSELSLTKLPSLLSFPKSIHWLNLKGNHIESINEDTFYNGGGVLGLDLSNNIIDFLSVEAFRGFKNLQRLSLGHNRLWNLNEKSFVGLSVLTYLDISFNDQHNFLPDLFKGLTELKELHLEGNPLKALQDKQFEFLTNVEELHLDSTMLEMLPDNVFIYTPRLRILTLANNRIKQVPTTALKNLINLRILDLRGNPIQVIGPRAFFGLEKLSILYLSQMPALEVIEAHAFGDLRSLRELHCNYNILLSEIHQEAFVNKSNRQRVTVEQLLLRQNNLDTISPKLQKWNPNMEVQLDDNPWDCNCLMFWMLDLQTKNRFQEHLRCATPFQLRGRLLSELKTEELPCGIKLSDVIIISAASTVCVMLLILVVVFIAHKKANARRNNKRFKPAPSNSDFEDVVYERKFDGMDMY